MSKSRSVFLMTLTLGMLLAPDMAQGRRPPSLRTEAA